MIEGVKSSLVSSIINKNVILDNSTQNSMSANPEKIQKAATAPYVSPYISIDKNHNKAVLQIRDSDTGTVLRQFPTENQLQAYDRARELGIQTPSGGLDSRAEARSQVESDTSNRNTPRSEDNKKSTE